MKECTITNCHGKHEAKGYCRKHYRKWKRYGNPLEPTKPKGPKPLDPEEKKRRMAERGKKWYQANREKTIERVIAWRDANEDHYKRYHTIYNANQRAEAFGLSERLEVADLEALEESSDGCAKCSKEFGDKSHNRSTLDHIIAMVNGGPNTPENLQLICQECHYSKTGTDRCEYRWGGMIRSYP
jgi:5-methylcytosine-specific restriction endonuclease McrA